MSLTIITGVPGSGKTTYAVHRLRKKYFKDNVNQDFVIITNIEELKLDHVSLDELITELLWARLKAKCRQEGIDVYKETIKNEDQLRDHLLLSDEARQIYYDLLMTSTDDFFSMEVQKRIVQGRCQGKKVVYIIDEAQRYFPKYYKNREVCYFFEYHRHLGIDIWLLSQSIKKITTELTTVAEMEIRAKPRSFKVAGRNRYICYIEGLKAGSETFRPTKKDFELFKSYEAEESTKIVSPIYKMIALPGLFFLVTLYFFYKVLLSPGVAVSKESKAIVVPPTIPTIEKMNQAQELPSKKPEKPLLSKKSPIRAVNGQLPLTYETGYSWKPCSHVDMGNGNVLLLDPRCNSLVPLLLVDAPWRLIGKTYYIKLKIITPENDQRLENKS